MFGKEGPSSWRLRNGGPEDAGVRTAGTDGARTTRTECAGTAGPAGTASSGIKGATGPGPEDTITEDPTAGNLATAEPEDLETKEPGTGGSATGTGTAVAVDLIFLLVLLTDFTKVGLGVGETKKGDSRMLRNRGFSGGHLQS